MRDAYIDLSYLVTHDIMRTKGYDMPPRKMPPDEQVIEMYDSGMSCGEIAEKFDVSPITVNSLLRRAGHPRRSAREAGAIAKDRGRITPTRYWLGKEQPREMVEKRISKIRGENHWAWKGGDSMRPYRGIIDKVECANCGAADNLGIHHINLDHFDNNPENLQVLCVSCHMSLHKQAYWDAFHAGEDTPKSNGPIGWKREGGAGNGV